VTALAILAARAVRLAIRVLRPGGGSAAPGLVANRLAPTLLVDVINSFPEGLVIVSGSSGKSTTTSMLSALLRAHGLSVFTNHSTANIRQGLMSALLSEITLAGRARASIAVLEMDEAHGAKIVAELAPTTVVLTNVMTDQIDRFADPRDVAAMLEVIALRATRQLVLNADDAFVNAMPSSPEAVVSRYGVAESVIAELPHGLGNLRTTPTRLVDGVIVESVLDYSTRLRIRGVAVDVDLPARGVHYAIDLAAAVAAALAILGDSFDPTLAQQALSALAPVFGRGERVTVQGKLVELVLVQNPTSFQLNIDHLPPSIEQLLVAVGSDVRDPSYLWPVDTSSLGSVVTVSGSQAEEMALQLAYRGVSVGAVEPDLLRALDDFIALPDPADGVKTIVFSADSMRRTRRHWRLT